MYSNNLNGAHEYENERRNDERRAAAESQRLRELGVKRQARLSPGIMVGLLAMVIILLQLF